MTNNLTIIAEIGVNHNGDIRRAIKLVDEAKKAGASAVKFQSFKAERLASEHTPKVKYQERDSSSSSHFDMLKSLELSSEEQAQIISYCKTINIDFISTPYDLESVNLLYRLGVKTFKIASADIIDYTLHNRIREIANEVIISTGMATMDEISSCLELYSAHDVSVSLLHCVSNYPCSEKSLNLSVISTLSEKFRLPVGFSDHAEHNTASLLAYALGCRTFERHFTFDKTDVGPDHAASDEPQQFIQYVEGLKRARKIIGVPDKQIQEEEVQMRSVARKSLFWRVDKQKGDTISLSDFIPLRPGDGLSPMEIPGLLGKRTNKKVSSGKIIEESDFY